MRLLESGGARLRAGQIAHLGDGRLAARRLKERDRLNLHPHRGAVPVPVERGVGILRVPRCEPRLVQQGCLKGPHELVIDFRQRPDVPLARGHVVGEEIPGHRLVRRGAATHRRQEVNDPRGLIDPDHVGHDGLEGSKECNGTHAQRREYAGDGGHPPGPAVRSVELSTPVGVPALCLFKVRLKRAIGRHGVSLGRSRIRLRAGTGRDTPVTGGARCCRHSR